MIKIELRDQYVDKLNMSLHPHIPSNGMIAEFLGRFDYDDEVVLNMYGSLFKEEPTGTTTDVNTRSVVWEDVLPSVLEVIKDAEDYHDIMVILETA